MSIAKKADLPVFTESQVYHNSAISCKVDAALSNGHWTDGVLLIRYDHDAIAPHSAAVTDRGVNT